MFGSLLSVSLLDSLSFCHYPVKAHQNVWIHPHRFTTFGSIKKFQISINSCELPQAVIMIFSIHDLEEYYCRGCFLLPVLIDAYIFCPIGAEYDEPEGEEEGPADQLP